jgi:hypothetical protein
MRVAYLPLRKYRPIRPTGNCNPALAELLVEVFFSPRPPFPFPFPVPVPDMMCLLLNFVLVDYQETGLGQNLTEGKVGETEGK